LDQRIGYSFTIELSQQVRSIIQDGLINPGHQNPNIRFRVGIPLGFRFRFLKSLVRGYSGRADKSYSPCRPYNKLVMMSTNL
jgi:hypothetical protein